VEHEIIDNIDGFMILEWGGVGYIIYQLIVEPEIVLIEQVKNEEYG